MEVFGEMDAPPEIEQGHVHRIVVNDEEYVASDHSPYVIIRVAKGVGVSTTDAWAMPPLPAPPR